MKSIKTNKVEQTIIKKSHKLYKTIEDFSIRSNNFYNYANYIVRQEFIKNNNFLNYQHLQKELKTHEPYKALMSQSSQCQLRLLEKNWKSYFKGIKEWKKTPSKFLGMPKLPKYKKKGGRHIWLLKNNQTYIKDGCLNFRIKAMNGYKFKTNIKGRLISVRFVPRNDIFVLEIIYEEEVKTKEEHNNNFVSIDYGVNNFITMINNIGKKPLIIKGGVIKSINQFYNKRRAKYQSELPKNIYWSKRLDRITNKRYNKIKNYIHHTTKYIVEYCLNNNIDNIIIGHNKKRKQKCNLGSRNNQNFISIPYDMLIMQLEYKSKFNGINLKIVDESYTSGTSFLDNEEPIKENYNIKRRKSRGCFVSDQGFKINSDINSAYQISKKVFPNALADGIEVCLAPITIRNVINGI